MSQQITSPSAEVAAVLAAVEAFDWTTVSHAYGEATDLPEMLRALALDDDTGTDNAAGDLWGSICHQGTVYSASAAVVPFLARLAAAGAASKQCIWLLGAMAASDDTAPGAEEDVRDAVRAEVGRLLPFASHPDVDVRQATVHAIGQARTPDVLPTLRTVLERDSAELVRAEALIALVRCGAPDREALITAAQGDGADAVRLASVFAALDAGLPWSDRAREALLSVRNYTGIGVRMLDVGRAEPLSWVVGQLCDGEQGEQAARLLLDAAERDTADLRAVLWAARRAVEASRAATELLRSLAAKHADDDDGRRLAEAMGLRPSRTPAFQLGEPTIAQALRMTEEPGIEELRELAAAPLPPYGQLTTRDIDRKLVAAQAVWERTNDPSLVLGAVTEVADRLSGRDRYSWWGYQCAAAARTAVLLGPAAAPVEAGLRSFLADPIALAAAATALVQAGCDVAVDEVAQRLAGQAGEYSEADTVTALATLAPLLSEASVRRWQEVIDQDRRLVRGGIQGSVIEADERFRAELREALAGRDGR
ncbi:HEAT repeat domain-containing protein [Promicromonospora sp. NPDC060204]|uniref:HEAT repeat domain-containing protein n=1 Tax=Promicromonospora sp. NPDC060204 TaxID=3347071 RepID=UPI00365B5D2F